MQGDSEGTGTEDDDRVGAIVPLFGAYWLGLAVWRAPEVWGLPLNSAVMAPFPPWLVAYLYVLIAWLGATGALWLACAWRLRRGRAVPRLGVVAAVSSLALVLVHGWFTLARDAAIGAGGAVWGVVHVLTLTRDFVPDGATAAGALGFRVGQGIGLAIWLGAAIAVAAEVLRPRFVGRAAR